MSKIFNSALMNAIVDMEYDANNDVLSPEDKEVYNQLLARRSKLTIRLNGLAENISSLDSAQLIELKELIDDAHEWNEIAAQRMTSEEIQRIVDNLASREMTMPMSGRIKLEVFRKILKSKKAK